VTREQVQTWLDAYVDAWRTYDPGAIGELFGADARYAYHPYCATTPTGAAASSSSGSSSTPRGRNGRPQALAAIRGANCITEGK
jgi:hypothetical protein